MRYLIFLLLFKITGCTNDTSSNIEIPDANSPEDPVYEDIFIADPTIYKENGTYILYGTSQGNLERKGLGFLAFTSDNLTDWDGPNGTSGGFALRLQSAFGNQGFWAPQVLKHDNLYYMAYTANEKIGLATSDNPLGLFTNSGSSINDEVKQIDPYIFIDDDGKKYLYHVRFNNGNKIYVAELNDDLETIKEETLTEIIAAEEQWENTQNQAWSVAEGPTVFKEDDTYYLIYSANDFRNQDYAVGYATSDNPLGPWKKSENNPIIHGSDVGEYGVGHGDLLRDQNDKMLYVLHAHNSSTAVHPRVSAIIELELTSGELKSKPDSFRRLQRQVN